MASNVGTSTMTCARARPRAIVWHATASATRIDPRRMPMRLPPSPDCGMNNGTRAVKVYLAFCSRPFHGGRDTYDAVQREPSVAATRAIIFVVSAALYAALAAPIPFYDKGEPREALVVQAIVRDHGVILPRRGGRDIPSKPPLFHWLAALAMRTGMIPEELAVRSPSVLLGAAGVALAATIAVRAHGVTAGLLTALVLGSSFEWLRAATQSRVDMTLTFFLLITTLAWHAAVSEA